MCVGRTQRISRCPIGSGRPTPERTAEPAGFDKSALAIGAPLPPQGPSRIRCLPAVPRRGATLPQPPPRTPPLAQRVSLVGKHWHRPAQGRPEIVEKDARDAGAKARRPPPRHTEIPRACWDRRNLRPPVFAPRGHSIARDRDLRSWRERRRRSLVTTFKERVANRENARRSTGPRTEEGNRGSR